MRTTAVGAGFRWGALSALLGGLVAVVGVFLAWATLTSVGSLVSPVETTVGVPGIRHWTGLVGLVGSGVALLGAVGAGTFDDSPGRRQGALVAAVAGVVTVAAALMGLAQREAIATAGLPGGARALEFARDFAAEFNEELELDIPAPRVAAGPGLFLTLAGGGLAAAGGVLALIQEAPHRRGLRFAR